MALWSEKSVQPKGLTSRLDQSVSLQMSSSSVTVDAAVTVLESDKALDWVAITMGFELLSFW